MSPQELLDYLTERYTVYAFSSHEGIISVSKLPNLTRYLIGVRGKTDCNCPGFLSKGVCKHVKMLQGAWTNDLEGTKSWFESEFGDIFDASDLPEEFATAIIKHELPWGFKFLCLTVRYKRYRMGVIVVDPSYNREEFIGER